MGLLPERWTAPLTGSMTDPPTSAQIPSMRATAATPEALQPTPQEAAICQPASAVAVARQPLSPAPAGNLPVPMTDHRWRPQSGWAHCATGTALHACRYRRGNNAAPALAAHDHPARGHPDRPPAAGTCPAGNPTLS